MLINEKKSFTLLELVMILLVVILMVQVFSSYLGGSRTSVNDALAQKNLRHMSAAAEAFAGDNGGYPISMSNLVLSVPAYIEQDYCQPPIAISGFIYSCTMWSGGYSFMANPEFLGTSGTTTYTITTGGVWL